MTGADADPAADRGATMREGSVDGPASAEHVGNPDARRADLAGVRMSGSSRRITHAAAATVLVAAVLAFSVVVCCQTADSHCPTCSRSGSVDIALGRACTADLLADGSGADRLPAPQRLDRVGPPAPAPIRWLPASTVPPTSLPSTLHAVSSPLLC